MKRCVLLLALLLPLLTTGCAQEVAAAAEPFQIPTNYPWLYRRNWGPDGRMIVRVDYMGLTGSLKSYSVVGGVTIAIVDKIEIAAVEMDKLKAMILDAAQNNPLASTTTPPAGKIVQEYGAMDLTTGRRFVLKQYKWDGTPQWYENPSPSTAKLLEIIMDWAG